MKMQRLHRFRRIELVSKISAFFLLCGLTSKKVCSLEIANIEKFPTIHALINVVERLLHFAKAGFCFFAPNRHKIL